MTGRAIGILLRRLEKSAGPLALSDAALLERFALYRDEAAFGVLLERFGPMVLGVCRRIVGDEHAAEDAFQATFLVLARKAPSLAQQELVGTWLWGVALRTAQRVKAAANRWQRRRPEVRKTMGPEPVDELIWRDLGPVLDEEIDRLPGKYRQVFVLCYLQGTTNEEAARKLGCPPGTVFTRLARARAILRNRLTRRGITLSAAFFGTSLIQEATARVPAALARSTLQAATLFATGGVGAAGTIAPHASQVAQSVMRALFIAKAKFTAAVVLAIAALGSAGTLCTQRGSMAALDGTARMVQPAPTLVAEAPRPSQTPLPSAPAPAKSDMPRHEDDGVNIGMGLGASSEGATATVTIDGRRIRVTVQGSKKLAALARPEVAQSLALTKGQRELLHQLQTKQQNAFADILPHHPIKAAGVPGLLRQLEQAPERFRAWTRKTDTAIDALLTDFQRKRLEQLLRQEQLKPVSAHSIDPEDAGPNADTDGP